MKTDTTEANNPLDLERKSRYDCMEFSLMVKNSFNRQRRFLVRAMNTTALAILARLINIANLNRKSTFATFIFKSADFQKDGES